MCGNFFRWVWRGSAVSASGFSSIEIFGRTCVAIWGLERVVAQMRGLYGVISPGNMRLLSDGSGCTFSRPLRAEIVEQQEQALAEGTEDLKMHRGGAR